LNFDFNQSSIVINDNTMQGIHFDLSNNNLYIASWNGRSIYIYHTNNEITFNKIHTVSSTIRLGGITTSNDKIYTGAENGAILVYDKLNYTLIQVLANMCPIFIWSVKFDCNGNMIYSCQSPPIVKIIGANGINSTLILSGSITDAFGTYIDSMNRLWIGGNGGFVVFN
jgi:outer membrane protein assembly factor BamB